MVCISCLLALSTDTRSANYVDWSRRAYQNKRTLELISQADLDLRDQDKLTRCTGTDEFGKPFATIIAKR